jgi:peptide subunit release factor 1 (eRF1)
MITLSEIQTLASRPARPCTSVLTIYLDADQSRQANLNRGFENELRDMLTNVRNGISDDAELQRFQSAQKRVMDFFATYEIRARGLALAVDVSDGFFWSSDLDFPVRNEIRWDRCVFVQPLAVAIDENETVGVVLVDRANVRAFTMSLGRVREHIREKFDPKKVQHTKTAGMDHLGSAGRAQRIADEHVQQYLRHVTRNIDPLFELHGVRRIVLAGSPEITAALTMHLSKRLETRVIGRVDIPLGATLDEIQAAVAPIAERFERETEEALVTDLVTSAAKSKVAVVGVGHTLQALNERRVWQLLYVDGLYSSGYECPGCAALFSAETTVCSKCGSRLAAVANVVERAVDRAARIGARIEVVRSEKPESVLLNAGGMGAFLKTRTASARVS